MTTEQRIERLERFSHQVNRDMYGYGNDDGIGAMSRLKTLEDQSREQRLTRRWLLALIVTTFVGAAKIFADVLTALLG